MTHRWRTLARRTTLAALLPLTLTACSSSGNNPPQNGTPDAPVTITMWRTFDSNEVFDPIIRDFELNNPNINIDYKELPLDEYELVTSEALAAGEGPDIWSIRNDWVPRHQNKLVPMPQRLLPDPNNQYANDEEALNAAFVPVVAQNVVRDGRVYGLP